MARIATKWPLLLVAGKPVTPEQADDILLRSCGGYFTGNDPAWERQIAAILGIPFRTGYPRMDWQACAAWYKSIGGLDLHYLNNSRVYSAWIGGPRGWCDWDGRIGCGEWNIGKWPGVSEVEEDLAAVAATWPFLQMRVQLVDNEGEGDLCGEWAVTGGKAMEVEPGGLIVAPEFDTDAAVLGLVFGHGRERGVSPERLASAYARIRTAQP
jgi:hypothetical protein